MTPEQIAAAGGVLVLLVRELDRLVDARERRRGRRRTRRTDTDRDRQHVMFRRPWVWRRR